MSTVLADDKMYLFIHGAALPLDFGEHIMHRKANRKLIAARKAQCWSLEEAANAIGVSTQTYFRWEHYLQVPHPSSLRLLCAAFGVSSPKELGF